MPDSPTTFSPSDPGEVVAAWNDVVYFTDAHGIVFQTAGHPIRYLPATSAIGKAFWDVLALEPKTLQHVLQTFPPLGVHEISCCDDRSYLIRIIPLPSPMAAESGYVVVATDNRPMEALYETYEERLEDNITAWSDSITLFNAFFDAAKDAMFLADDAGNILSFNCAARDKHTVSEHDLAGKHCAELLGNRFREPFRLAMARLSSKEAWVENVVALDADGEAFPAEASLQKITLSGYSLFQLTLHDLSTQMGLEEDLEDLQAEVEEKDIALKHVIQSVEEERQKMRDQLTDHVKKQMLPALDRMTSSDAQEVREGYKSVIEDQLDDLAGDSHISIDSDLLKLSPREMQVCQLIQLGRSGKGIAQTLNMSFETVQTHRKNIRKKLDLRGKHISLYAYLKNKPSLT